VGIAALIGTLLYLGMRSASLLGTALARLGRIVNAILRPFLRRDYIDTSKAHTFANEIAAGLKLAKAKPRGWLLPGALALSNKALLILILFLVFLAFKQPYTPSILVAGFSIGFLFLIVSPTPSGVGFVEPAMALALNSLNIPLGTAAVISLAFRGITFWAPLLVGMIAFRWASRQPEQTRSADLPLQTNPLPTQPDKPPAAD
jgi:uncharacterized protein (TIRG00374 family)